MLFRSSDHVLLAVADCTGHGVPGAFMSMLGVALLNEISRRKEITQPNHVLNTMRHELKSCLQQKGNEYEADDGLNLAFITIEFDKNKLQYAGAFNPLYLVRNNELIIIEADKMPIGIHHTEKESFTNHTIQLQKADAFYLFTDGYIDQFGGPDNTRFTSQRFKNLIMDIHSKHMHKQKLIFNKIIEKWMKNETQIDDMTIVGFRVP